MPVLNGDQLLAYKLIDEGHNLVVLGQAGTGKSVLIRETQCRLLSKGKRVSVVASTGIAATQFSNATTLHSWGGLQDGHLTNDELLKKISPRNVQDIRDTEVLIVDETSMTSAKIFEQLEFVCRSVRQVELFFLGIQIICVGDWFQIPPVPNKSTNDPGKHCFTSSVWKAVMKHKIVLIKVLRQTDLQLITAINEMEMGTPSQSTNLFVDKLSRPLPLGDKPTVLYGTNFEVDWHNACELNKLTGEMTLLLPKRHYFSNLTKSNGFKGCQQQIN